MQKKFTLSKKQGVNIFLMSVRKGGHYLSRMVMPNMPIFISIGVLSFIANYVTQDVYQVLMQVEHTFIYRVLPILIGYTGGNLVEKKHGGIVGAIATAGMIVMSTIPQIFGSMLMGPLSAYFFQCIKKYVLPRIKNGFEMLIQNLLAGVVGALFCFFGLFIMGPILEVVNQQMMQMITFLIQKNVLLFVHVLVEPLKILFLNNVLNHGIFTPIGIGTAQQAGKSILFLLEANPGPGLGVLLALLRMSRKKERQNLGSVAIIQFMGGIHEVYFPFVLMQPKLLVALIAGGMSGTFLFQWLNVGLHRPVSPGSIILILSNVPADKLGSLCMGIFASAFVSFCFASFLLKKDKKTTKEMEKPLMKQENIKQIIFACDAGMGSSAMGASLLQKQLKEYHLSMPVLYCSVYDLTNQANTLIIVQQELALIAKEKAPTSRIYVIENFLDMTHIVETLFPDLKVDVSTTGLEKLPVSPFLPIIFLYQDNRRGSQTMAMEILRQMAANDNQIVDVRKEAIEYVAVTDQHLYIVTNELAQRYQLEKENVPLLVVEDWLETTPYEQLLKGEINDAFIRERTSTIKRISH